MASTGVFSLCSTLVAIQNNLTKPSLVGMQLWPDIATITFQLLNTITLPIIFMHLSPSIIIINMLFFYFLSFHHITPVPCEAQVVLLLMSRRLCRCLRMQMASLKGGPLQSYLHPSTGNTHSSLFLAHNRQFFCSKRLSTWNFKRHVSVTCELIGCRVHGTYATGLGASKPFVILPSILVHQHVREFIEKYPKSSILTSNTPIICLCVGLTNISPDVMLSHPDSPYFDHNIPS